MVMYQKNPHIHIPSLQWPADKLRDGGAVYRVIVLSITAHAIRLDADGDRGVSHLVGFARVAKRVVLSSMPSLYLSYESTESKLERAFCRHTPSGISLPKWSKVLV